MCAILDKMEKENICKNCTYFVQHYAKIDKARVDLPWSICAIMQKFLIFDFLPIYLP